MAVYPANPGDATTRSGPAPGYDLLSARISTFVRLVSWGTVFLSLLSGVASGDFVVPLCAIGSALISLTAATYQKDMLRLLLVAHPTISYMFFTLAYGFLNGNPGLSGLLNAGRGFTITLIYQFAILGADIFISMVAGRKHDASTIDTTTPNPYAMRAGWVLVGVLAAFASARQTFLTAHIPVLVGLIVASVVWTVHARDGRKVLLLAVFTLGAFFLISSITNGRTILLVLLLAWVLLLLAYARRLFTIRNLLFGVLCVCLLNWITFAFLEARKTRTATSDVFEETINIAFSEEGLLHLVLMGTPEFRSDPIGSAYRSDFIRTSVWGRVDDTSVAGRLALIAHMDIVTGRLPEPTEVNWGLVGGTIGSVMPNFGDKQELLLSDELVWALSLRPRGSVGRPLVTVAGELYAIGGFQFILGAGFVLYAGLIGLLVVFDRISRNKLVYLVTGVALLGSVTLTGTFAGLMASSFRMLPEFLVLLYLLAAHNRLGSQAVPAH